MSRLVRRDVRLGNSVFSLQASPVRAQITTVAPAVANQAQAAGAATETDTDDYATRMVKYIPAEVVAFYLAADKLFAKGAEIANANIADTFVAKHLYVFSVVVFMFGLVGTPLYLRQQATGDEPWQVQATISTGAFVIWAYAVQGQIFTPVYSSAIAAFLVLVFTFASGFVKPGK
jgi:hypothetical protein